MSVASVSSNPNAALKFSAAARMRLRGREKEVRNYYDDMGPGRGNCTWGAGILAHRGPCTKAELQLPVTPTAIAAEFSARILVAERAVRAKVTHQSISQGQFDALVSFAFNVGQGAAGKTMEMVDEGKFSRAATMISAQTRVRVKTKSGSRYEIAKGLIIRRAEESAPFRK